MKKWFRSLLSRLFKKHKSEKQHVSAIKTYVVALNYQHFRYWCYVNERNVHDRSLHYVLGVDTLCGIDGRYAKFVFYGPWQERKDADEIVELIKIIEMMAS